MDSPFVPTPPGRAKERREIEIAGERLVLLAERAVYWPRERALLIADAHLGKAASFRASAVAIPRGTTTSDLGRISRLIRETAAQRIIFLGDLLHSEEGRARETLRVVSEWRNRHPEIEMTLVRGNHDKKAGDPPPGWNVESVNEPFSRSPFVLRHRPTLDEMGYVLSGHIHPAARLDGPGRQGDRLPCFHFGPSVGILPAFGSFTGTARIRPMEGDRIYVVADGHLIDCC